MSSNMTAILFLRQFFGELRGCSSTRLEVSTIAQCVYYCPVYFDVSTIAQCTLMCLLLRSVLCCVYQATSTCSFMKDLAFFLQQVKVMRQYRAFMRLHKHVCMSESLGAKSPRAQVDHLHSARIGVLATHNTHAR